MLHLHLKAWLVYSVVKATSPAQLYADPHAGGFQRHARNIAGTELDQEYIPSVPV